jgi:hypothetical protein
MNIREGRDMHIDTQDSLLDRIERAVAEKMQTGHADEARYEFAARVANATPPVNKDFQQALRARILTELTVNTKGKTQTMTIKNRVQIVNFWRLSLAGIAAMIILVLAFVASQRISIGEPGMRVNVPTTVSAFQLDDGDVDALVDRLNKDAAPRTVLIFPADYAETLVERIEHQVVPLVLDGDLTPTTIQAALGAALPSSGLVDVILVNQEATGATQQVLEALERRLYRLYRPGEATTETFGTLECTQFIVGPQDVTLEPIGAIFDGGLELVAGSVPSDPHPGTPLPLAFDWRVREAVSDSLAMFAHLVYDQGRLIAQWDAVPGTELFPVESWKPGDLVRHQFALHLPPELPAGEYELQVGIYSATSGQRYSLVEPEGGTYVIVQQFTIRE